MSRVLHGIEKGIRLYEENADTSRDILFGAAVPGSDADTNAAGIGSLYLMDGGQVYQKKTAGAGADKWERKATVSDLTALTFRKEKVIAATAQVAPASGATIDLVAAPLTGDEAPTLVGADFALDTYILFGVGGVPKLMQVSNIAGDVITLLDPPGEADQLVDGDNIVVEHYLLDTPDGQEKQALLHYTGGAILKLSDFNWALADGISLNGSIVDRNGPVIGTDTLQVAVEKLEGDCKDATTLSGVARGAVNLGTFTGKNIPDSSTIKAALQALESAIEARTIEATVIAARTIDTVLVDTVKVVKWLVHVFEEATPANLVAMEVYALHNGTAAADATSVDDTLFAKLKSGAAFNLTLSVDLAGVGAAQEMRLRAASTTAGVTVTARRIEVY